MLDAVKASLRISQDTTAFDDEIIDLINAAEADLVMVGVSKAAVTGSDPLIKRAIISYCKAYFGNDNSDAERLRACYEMLRNHLSLAEEYR